MKSLLHLLLPLLLPVLSLAEVPAYDAGPLRREPEFMYTAFEDHLGAHLRRLESEGYTPYELDKGNVRYRELRLHVNDENLNFNPGVMEFVRTLQDPQTKRELMDLYGLKNYQYNELAKRAFAVLGSESSFYGLKYVLKNSAVVQPVVTLEKIRRAHVERNREVEECVETEFETNGIQRTARSYARLHIACDEKAAPVTTELNSRGPTQIKTVPAPVAEAYGITPDSLSDPRHAAIATVAFLAQSAQELRGLKQKHDLDCITDENFYDSLLYIYRGQTSLLKTCTAEPDQNGYVLNNRRYQELLVMYEGEPENASSSYSGTVRPQPRPESRRALE